MTTREEEPYMEESMKIHFNDEGRFTVVDSKVVQSGEYKVSTCVVENTIPGGSSQWEIDFKVTPDELQIVLADESEPYPFGYNNDQVISLFSVAEDPEGEKAKLIHDKVVELIKKGIDPDTINYGLRAGVINVKGFLL